MQVSLYSEKFDEFQNSLNKSNEMFNTFRKEMDKVHYHMFSLRTCVYDLGASASDSMNKGAHNSINSKT